MKILTKSQQGLIFSSIVKFQPSKKIGIKLLKLDFDFNLPSGSNLIRFQTQNKKQYIIIRSCTSIIQAILLLASSTKQNQLITIQQINVYKIKNDASSELCFFSTGKMSYYKSGLDQIRFSEIQQKQSQQIFLILQIIFESLKVQHQHNVKKQQQNQYKMSQVIRNNLNYLSYLSQTLLQTLVNIYQYKHDLFSQIAVLNYFLQQYPQSTFALIKLANIRFFQKSYSKCQKLVLQLPTQSLAGMQIKLKLLVVNQKEEIVKEQCKQIIQQIQQSSLSQLSCIPFHTILHQLFLKKSNFIEAHQEIQKIINIFKKQIFLNKKDEFKKSILEKRFVEIVLYKSELYLKQGLYTKSLSLLKQIVQDNNTLNKQEQDNIHNKIIIIENKKNMNLKILDNVDNKKRSQYEKFVNNQFKEEDKKIEFLNKMTLEIQQEQVDKNSLRYLEIELIKIFIKMQLKQQINLTQIQQLIDMQYDFEADNLKNTLTLLKFFKTENIEKKSQLMKKLMKEFPSMSAYYMDMVNQLQNRTEITENNDKIIKELQQRGFIMRALELSYKLQLHSKMFSYKQNLKSTADIQNLTEVNKNRLVKLQCLFQLNTSSKLNNQKQQLSANPLNINNQTQLYQKLITQSNQKGSIHPLTLQLTLQLAKLYYDSNKYFQSLIYSIHYINSIEMNNSCIQNQTKISFQKVMQMSEQQIQQTEQLCLQNNWQLTIVSLLRKIYYSDNEEKQLFKEYLFSQENEQK